MKSKTIKKILSSVLEKWATSVGANPEIKRIIMEDTIITGGCIASMLLNEPVNDYDIYLNSKKSAMAMARFYSEMIKGDRKVSVMDGKDYEGFSYDELCSTAGGEDFDREYADKFNIDSHQMGRCVSDLTPDRVKLYMVDGMYRVPDAEWKEEDESEKSHYPKFFSPNAITLTDDVQIVIRFHGDADKIHENYDFVHATNYYAKGVLTLRQEALESLLTKDLRYICSKYPITSIIRSKKFINRGFRIGAGEYLKMCYQVSELDLNNLSVLEEQLASVDVAYFEILLDALKNKGKDFKLNYGYLAKMLDSIFN